MASFSSLPHELVLHVLKHLDPAETNSLARTCRAVNVTATPALYRSVKLKYSENEFYWDDLLDFSHTLVTRPDLASHVRNIAFLCDHFDEDQPNELEVDDGCKDALLAKVNTLDEIYNDLGLEPPLMSKIEDEDLFGSIGSLIPFILSLVHNVEVVEIGYGLVHFFPGLSEPFVKSKMDSWKGSRFSKLKAFRYSLYQNADSLQLDTYQTEMPEKELMILPFTFTSVEEIDIVMRHTPPKDLESIILPNLTTFRLRYSDVGIRSVCRLLEGMPNLENFAYGFVQQVDQLHGDEDTHTFEWNMLWEALLTLRSSLKTLLISTESHVISDYKPDDWDDEWYSGVWRRRGSLGSMRAFTSLHRLEAPIHVLVGYDPNRARKLVDLLPPNLTDLCVRDDLVDEWTYRWTPWEQGVVGAKLGESFKDTVDVTRVLDQLEDVFADRANVPRLRRFVYNCHWKRQWPNDRFHDLERVCRAVGVAASMTVNHQDGFQVLEVGVIADSERPVTLVTGPFPARRQVLDDEFFL